MKYTTTDYGNKKEILYFPEHFVPLAVTVSDAGIVADADGRKIVKAGTIAGGNLLSVLQKIDEPVTAHNDAGADGVLLNDVDVTYGNAPGSLVIHGFVDLNKLPEAPAAAAITALKQITFLK
jgi:hypothetical protein